jgi:TetR/AcrR family transcriptional repressor of uid operon
MGEEMTKRSEDGGRARVIATARALFQQKGFHQTAMADLSDRSGVSVGQIYRLFACKSDMIAAIVQEDTEARLTRLTEILDGVGAGRCTAREGFRQAVLDGLNEGKEALTFEILAEGFRNPQVGGEIGELCERYRAMLGKMIRAAGGSVEGARLVAAEDMLLAVIFGLSNRALSRPVLGVEETAAHAADMILHMIGADPGPRRRAD